MCWGLQIIQALADGLTSLQCIHALYAPCPSIAHSRQSWICARPFVHICRVEKGTDDQQKFVQNLALFFTGFFKVWSPAHHQVSWPGTQAVCYQAAPGRRAVDDAPPICRQGRQRAWLGAGGVR